MFLFLVGDYRLWLITGQQLHRLLHPFFQPLVFSGFFEQTDKSFFFNFVVRVEIILCFVALFFAYLACRLRAFGFKKICDFFGYFGKCVFFVEAGLVFLQVDFYHGFPPF